MRNYIYAFVLFGLSFQSCDSKNSDTTSNNKVVQEKKELNDSLTVVHSSSSIDTLLNSSDSLQGIHFHIVATNEDGITSITISPSGLENFDESFQAITNSKNVSYSIEDLDADGSPELIVIAQLDDLKTDLFAYSTFNKKSMGLINFQENTPELKSEKAHLIKKEYAVVETCLSRRNTYQKEDGSTYVIQTDYKLIEGEAMKQLVKKKEYLY
ncbi:MAG: hypothetical protein R2799_05165 [Crocinitomicaceae bacterium]